MNLKNCWEYMQCGREPDGSKADALGVCPSAIEGEFDGINRGKNAGRCCWIVAGTLCNGEIQGTFAGKLEDCFMCPFFQRVANEEGKFLVLVRSEAERFLAKGRVAVKHHKQVA